MREKINLKNIWNKWSNRFENLFEGVSVLWERNKY